MLSKEFKNFYFRKIKFSIYNPLRKNETKSKHRQIASKFLYIYVSHIVTKVNAPCGFIY